MSKQNYNQKLEEYLNDRQTSDWTPVIKFMGALIYVLILMYSGSHVLSFVSSLMQEQSLRIMSYAGGIGIILNGAVLPLAIHSWTMETKHRLAAILFYVLDIALIGMFVWANTNIVRGTGLELAEEFMTWIGPVTFLNGLITWGVLFTLDPEHRVKFKLSSLEQEAKIIDLKSEMIVMIAAAEARAEQLLLQSGLDLSDNQNNTRNRYSGDALDYQNVMPRNRYSGDGLDFSGDGLDFSGDGPDFSGASIFSGDLEPLDQKLYETHLQDKQNSGNHSGTVPKA